jgi:predicted nucleic acid-binding protein
LVITDTAIWIDYLRNRRSSLADEVSKLIDDGRVALASVVLAELLRGLRTQEERHRLEWQLQGATFLEMSMAAWRHAGVLSSDLDSRGQPIPMTDVFIAALALEGGHELYTRDKHFERIPGLRLYQPEGDA